MKKDIEEFKKKLHQSKLFNASIDALKKEKDKTNKLCIDYNIGLLLHYYSYKWYYNLDNDTLATLADDIHYEIYKGGL